MTIEGWRHAVSRAAYDSEFAERLAQLLCEQDHAKAVLQCKGYGCTGIPWAELVEEVPSVEVAK